MRTAPEPVSEPQAPESKAKRKDTQNGIGACASRGTKSTASSPRLGHLWHLEPRCICRPWQDAAAQQRKHNLETSLASQVQGSGILNHGALVGLGRMQQLSKGGQEDKYASKDKTTTAAAFMHAMSHIDGRRNEAVLYEPP